MITIIILFYFFPLTMAIVTTCIVGFTVWWLWMAKQYGFNERLGINEKYLKHEDDIHWF